MNQYFADLLRKARERSGLTQKELAKLIDVDNTYVSKIERGVLPPPSREKVLKIADVLEITNKVERYHLLLTAGCAGIEDLEGLDEAADRLRHTPIPQRHAAFVLAHPPISRVKNTIGKRIERLIDVTNLSDEERETVENYLEAIAKETLTLMTTARQLGQTSNDRS
jgi:transcriptional regulator with XRE-family HTH domain